MNLTKEKHATHTPGPWGIQIGHKGEWVNPRYVTSIEHAELYLNGPRPNPPTKGSKIWVVGNAGYGTYSVATTLSPNEVAEKLNDFAKVEGGEG